MPGEQRAMRHKDFQLQQASLEEMLADPIVWMLMKSDRIEEHELPSLAETCDVRVSCGRRADASDDDGN
jgi:hypothetical protein